MNRATFTDEQIIGILGAQVVGARCTDLCREHAMSEEASCIWNAKVCSMTVSEAKRPRLLEDQNASWRICRPSRCLIWPRRRSGLRNW